MKTNKNFTRRRLALVFASFVLGYFILISGVVLANDDIACPGGDFGRSGVFPGTGPNKLPETRKLLVEQSLKYPFTSFLVHANKLLFVNYEKLIVANLEGEKLWEADVALPVLRPAITVTINQATGQRESATAFPLHQLLGWRDRVIVVGINGAVKTFMLNDGRLVWSVAGREIKEHEPLLKENPNRAGLLPLPVIHKDTLLFAGNREILRLNLEDGKELNAFEFLETGKDRLIFDSPLAASDKALFFSARFETSDIAHCYGIVLESGKLLWKHDGWKYRDSIYAADEKVFIIGRRLNGKSSGTVTQSCPAIVTILDSTFGIELPMKNHFRISDKMRPILHEKSLFVTEHHELSKIDNVKGRRIWTYKAKKQLGPTIFMSGNVIYITDASENIHAINGTDGSLMWTFENESNSRLLSNFESKDQTPTHTISMVPSNGALFRLHGSGIEVLGNPIAKKLATNVEAKLSLNPTAIRKEIEELNLKINDVRKEWEDCKKLLTETPISGTETDESKKKKEAASQRIREIGEAVHQFKARRSELEKLLK